MPDKQTNIRPNRDIENFILYSPGLYADKQWIMDQWSAYRAEVQLAGNDREMVIELVKERKRAQEPRLISGTVNLDDAAFRDKRGFGNNIPANSIAHLTLTGVMRAQGGMSTRGINELVDDLNFAFNHPNIKGILLEANTGGGEATAGNMLKGALENAPKAVVVYAHFLGSAGVMGTLTADEIILSGSAAQMGSVGTYITLRKGAPEMYKENYQDVYASKSTRKNEGFRAWMSGNLEVLQRNIDEFNEEFLNEVATHRPISQRSGKKIFTGAMFMAKEAKSMNLADGIGGFQYALKRLNANINLRKSA